jgi:Ca2+-binding EF-hand superfamily protein
MANDADGNGRVSRDEAPPPLQNRFDRVDRNGDGFIDEEEIEGMMQRSGRGGGSR